MYDRVAGSVGVADQREQRQVRVDCELLEVKVWMYQGSVC